MNLDLDKILKSADYVFEGVKDAEQAIDYIRVLVEKYHQRDSKNALVQIHAPDMTMISQRDLDELIAIRSKYDDLRVSYSALNSNYDQLQSKYDELDNLETNTFNANTNLQEKIANLSVELEHLKKSKGLCQLDSSGVCTYCDKRVLLAREIPNFLKKEGSE